MLTPDLKAKITHEATEWGLCALGMVTFPILCAIVIAIPLSGLLMLDVAWSVLRSLL
jgi:hypothetical protein